MQIKISLADWRDRVAIQSLRRLLKRPVDGGLYELLNWPMYHAHAAKIAVEKDGKLVDQIVGFSAVALHLNGEADDVGTVVHPDHRRQGIATALRATQVRDLSVMGFTHLYCAAPMGNEAATKWCEAVFGEFIDTVISSDIENHLYFGGPLHHIQGNLVRMGAPNPHPLSDINHERLLHKLQRALYDTVQIKAIGDFNLRKALIRQKV